MNALVWTAVLAAAPGGFWQTWGDGQAEVSGYRLVQPRYGAPRDGTAVLVFVTEPFSVADRVKADPGAPRKKGDAVLQVLKLNSMKSFRTGIYDYHLMTSAFLPVEPHPEARVLHPLKIAFSSQEWCGVVHEELTLHPSEVRGRRLSYFDGESDPAVKLPHPAGGIALDAMPVAVRGLLGPLLAAGETKSLPVLASLEKSRLDHEPVRWRTGVLSRAKDAREVEVPAGRFSAEIYALEIEGETWRWAVEAEGARRLLSWEAPGGERGELTGSDRLKYWSLTGPGQERHRARVGLPEGRSDGGF